MSSQAGIMLTALNSCESLYDMAKRQTKPSKPRKYKAEREDMEPLAIRCDSSYVRALEEIATADPERATVSTLVRRAIREYLKSQGKLGTETKL